MTLLKVDSYRAKSKKGIEIGNVIEIRKYVVLLLTRRMVVKVPSGSLGSLSSIAESLSRHPFLHDKFTQLYSNFLQFST